MREPRFPSLAKRRKALAIGAAALGLVALAACNPAPDKKAQNIVVVGSDTTQTAMATLSANYNATAKNTDPDSVYNILAVQTAAQTVPADSQADCVATTYHTPAGAGEVLAPNGSGAGRDALKASVANGDGCITIARSSAAPVPSAPRPAPTTRRSSTTPTRSTRSAGARPARWPRRT